MNLTTPIFFAFWGLLVLLAMVVSLGRLLRWRRNARELREEREAAYTAALDEVAQTEDEAVETSTASITTIPEGQALAPASAGVESVPTPEAVELSAVPGLLEFAGKRAILRIVFVDEDLLVGRRFWRPGRIGVAVWAKCGDIGAPGRTGQDR